MSWLREQGEASMLADGISSTWTGQSKNTKYNTLQFGISFKVILPVLWDQNNLVRDTMEFTTFRIQEFVFSCNTNFTAVTAFCVRLHISM